MAELRIVVILYLAHDGGPTRTEVFELEPHRSAMQSVVGAQGHADLLALGHQGSCLGELTNRFEALDQVFEDVVSMVGVADPRDVVMAVPRPLECLLVLTDRERTLFTRSPGMALELEIAKSFGSDACLTGGNPRSNSIGGGDTISRSRQ